MSHRHRMEGAVPSELRTTVVGACELGSRCEDGSECVPSEACEVNALGAVVERVDRARRAMRSDPLAYLALASITIACAGPWVIAAGTAGVVHIPVPGCGVTSMLGFTIAPGPLAAP